MMEGLALIDHVMLIVNWGRVGAARAENPLASFFELVLRIDTSCNAFSGTSLQNCIVRVYREDGHGFDVRPVYRLAVCLAGRGA